MGGLLQLWLVAAAHLAFHSLVLLVHSLRATEVRELTVGSWSWLVLRPVQIPRLVLVILCVCAEFGRAGEGAHRAKVLIKGVLHLVGRGWGRLLFGGAETIGRFRERTLDGRLHR